MGPKNVRSVTWYLNQVRIRTWDHFPVITRVDGRDIRIARGVKGWAGWTAVCLKRNRTGSRNWYFVLMRRGLHAPEAAAVPCEESSLGEAART